MHLTRILCIFVCRTFAYVTVKDRMPRILTQVIDTVNKEEAKMNALYGTVSYRIILILSSPILDVVHVHVVLFN